MPRAASIKIGHVSPRTGPLAGFGEADGFILEQVRGILAGGIAVGGKHLSGADHQQGQPVEREPRRRGRVRADPRRQGRPHRRRRDARHHQSGRRPGRGQRGALHHHQLPVAAVFLRPQGRSGQGLHLDLSFLLGPRGRDRAFLALWDSAPTNKVVGGLFPNDADGNAWGDPQRGLPPALAKAGYKLHRSRPLPADEQRLHRRRSPPSRRRAPRSSPAT